MTGFEILRLSVIIIFSVNALLLVVLLAAKGLHRRREKAHARRRSAYIAVLSQHLSGPETRVSFGKNIAEDQAFLDAVIDIRTVLNGEEAAAITAIVDRYGVSDQQGQRLSSRISRGRKVRAAVALAELADESAAPVLLEHLDDSQPEVRIQCARGLARMRWTPAIAVILDRLEKETPWVRSRFADSLTSFGSAATWPLVRYIRVNHRLSPHAVPTAIRTLAAIGDPEAINPTVEILDESTDIEIQLAAVETLGVLGVGADIYPIEKAARSEDWRLRAKAAKALGDVQDEAIMPTLTIGLHDANWWVRRNAAGALASTRAGIDVLYSAVLSDDSYARDAAVEALGDIGEVIAARDRIGAGQAATRDFELIEYVDGKSVVTT